MGIAGVVPVGGRAGFFSDDQRAILAGARLRATLGISFRSSDHAELASRIAGVTRTGDLAATITDEDPLRLYRTFVTIVLLCRDLVE